VPLTRPDAGASKGGGGGWPVLLTRRRDEGAAQAPEAVSGGDGGGTQENGDCEDGKGKVEKLVAWWWESGVVWLSHPLIRYNYFPVGPNPQKK
jgi:hypothetical protein